MTDLLTNKTRLEDLKARIRKTNELMATQMFSWTWQVWDYCCGMCRAARAMHIEFPSAEQYESQPPTNCYCISPHHVMFHTGNVTDLEIFSCILFDWCLRSRLLNGGYLRLVLLTSYEIIIIFLYFKGEVCKWMKTWTYDCLLLWLYV